MSCSSSLNTDFNADLYKLVQEFKEEKVKMGLDILNTYNETITMKLGILWQSIIFDPNLTSEPIQLQISNISNLLEKNKEQIDNLAKEIATEIGIIQTNSAI